MIYTLTTNPAIDMNIITDGIRSKYVNRTSTTVYTPNGKGLNVSFVLQHFNVPSTVLGFFGGFSGEYIVKEIEKRGFKSHPVWVEDLTRINVFLNDGEQEYKFVNGGSFVSRDKQDEMLDIIKSRKDMDYLSISGSLPPGISPEYYEEILSICNDKSVKVILDVSSPKLRELLRFRPYLIKPNDEEIAEIFGIVMKSEPDIVDALGYLHEKGAQNILLTLGEKGAYFSKGKDIYYVEAYPVKLLSSACAGDSSLAAFLSIWLENTKSIETALKRCAAVGANVAESNGIGDLAQVDNYMGKINVRRVNDK